MNKKKKRKKKLTAAELKAVGANQKLVYRRIVPPDPEEQRVAQRSEEERAYAVTLGRRLKRADRHAGPGGIGYEGEGCIANAAMCRH